jgi:hypothetical protein
MWPMFTNSFRLFLKGRLFRDTKAVALRWLIGVGASLVALVALRVVGAPLWLAVAVPSVGVGLLQPYLFRDLKYA